MSRQLSHVACLSETETPYPYADSLQIRYGVVKDCSVAEHWMSQQRITPNKATTLPAIIRCDRRAEDTIDCREAMKLFVPVCTCRQ